MNIRAQAPIGSEQHAPDWAGQGSGAHTVMSPWNVPEGAHAALVATVHAIVVLLQHAPTHGLGEQVEPRPLKNSMPPVHAVSPVTVHCPLVLLQHAPTHGFGEHEEPAPRNSWPFMHPATSLVWQVPAPLSQHAPARAGQGLGEHDDPLMNVPPLWKHALEDVTVHAIVVLLQHAAIWAAAILAGSTAPTTHRRTSKPDRNEESPRRVCIRVLHAGGACVQHTPAHFRRKKHSPAIAPERVAASGPLPPRRLASGARDHASAQNPFGMGRIVRRFNVYTARHCGMNENELVQSVGLRVRPAREKAGLTQEKLAAVAKMDRTFIGKIERGERGVTIGTLWRLARALKVSLSQLVEGL